MGEQELAFGSCVHCGVTVSWAHSSWEAKGGGVSLGSIHPGGLFSEASLEHMVKFKMSLSGRDSGGGHGHLSTLETH